MQPDYWNQLSFSSRRVLLWASALLNLRQEEHGSSGSPSQINVFDIFIGMLLEHPEDAEPLMLLRHFHLTPGQLLPPDYPRLSSEAIDRNLRPVTPESAMDLDPDANSIVQMGIDLGMKTGDSNVAELRALFSAMLEISNPLTNTLAGILDGLGVTLTEVSRSTREFVEKGAGKESYREFLNNRHPFNPRPIDIPNYKADHGHEHAPGDDMVGIRAEVDAFAYLLSSRGLSPPLAVGLFGDWGSGKSFFMESVRTRIEQLTQDPKVLDKKQTDVPFWKRIIQIEFNAWHYMEGELWASLVDHIFNQLRIKNEEEDLVQKRREYWLKKLDQTRAQIIQLVSRRKTAENNLRGKQEEAQMLFRQRDSELENLERLRAQTTSEILVKENLAEVRGVLDQYLISIGLPTAGEVNKKLNEAKTRVKKVGNLFKTLWSDPKSRWRAIISMCIPVLITGLFIALTKLRDFSPLTSVIGSVSTWMIAAGALFNKAMNMIQPSLDKLEHASKIVNEEIEAARNRLNEKIIASEALIEDAQSQLNTIMVEQKDLNKDLKDYQDQLERVTPVQVLNDFVAARVGSDDYRKHLGIPALIQNDFRQLARLITDQNNEILNDKKGKLEKNDEIFNRIILYIDDLDRCPDEHVIKVLQAVHLLLAFELFVVVVAVDSRWLSHALTKHFEALSLNNDNHAAATPDDYLEKIFQIPFWIQPLGESAKRNIINGLLQGHLTGKSEGEAQESDIEKPSMGEKQLNIIGTLDPGNAPPTLQTAALSITRAELKFLDELAPILGSTPRSTKRFVNLYQLVRIIYHLDPDRASNEVPKDHELLAFVLALGEGLSDLGPQILNEAVNAGPHENFNSIYLRIKISGPVQEVKRLDEWLAVHKNWNQIPAVRIADAFCKIDRFLFRIGAVNGRQRA